ncbi:bpX6 domain-containing protein [Kitasatospora sp. NPDC018058]|uniref:bpX6 domain-containing protein n=1 Tax=Kitasatospora sp. NPDC018058 TaxID=3364025 RepID=UPI0037BEE873
MSSPVTSPVDAVGFVLDVPVIGAAEAAERTLAHWQDGARLSELPDGRWLLTLVEPVRIRVDRAPGEPLRAAGGALVAAGASGGSSGEVALTVAGVTKRHVIPELRTLDPSDWLDLSGLTLHRLAPVGTPAVAEPVETDLPRPPAMDLRAAAGIAEPSERAGRFLGERRGTAGRTRPSWQLLVVGVVVALALYLALTTYGRFASVPIIFPVGIGALVGLSVVPYARTRSGRYGRKGRTGRSVRIVRSGLAGGREWWSFFVPALLCLLFGVAGLIATGFAGGLLLLTLLGACGVAVSVLPRIPVVAERARAARTARPAQAAARRAGAGTAAARQRPSRRPRGQWLARLALRTPVGPLFQERHVRYLNQLTRSFQRRRWEDALRDALPLAEGTSRSGLLSLRLPDRYAGELRPSPQERDGTPMASPISGPTVHQLLTDLYREAAEALEREGRIDEAAYVLADLLVAPAEAVALLDRHGRATQAAELAEGRGLAAELVVRLWWRAGQRERAVRIAQRRGAFAAAVERLSESDPASARELRTAWAEHRRRAGDRLGAVDAAWPDETLRPGLVGDLREALELGGAARGRALVHLLALGEDVAELARALFAAEGAEGTALAAALTALADLRCVDPVLDRELATAAVRSLVRTDGLAGHRDARGAAAVHTRLLKRADPLVAADLAKPRPARSGGGPLLVTAADRPGALPVLDAAHLDCGAVLAACGQAGVRLIGPDGRTRARWDVPAAQLVLADHGGTALLVARYGEVRELFRLDLATRKVERWTALRVRQLVPSYDGRHLLTVDQDGIAVLDTLTPRPTVVHRELGGDQVALRRIARTPDSCAALVHTRAGALAAELTELWRWDQPGWELRARTAVNPTDAVGAATLADGRMLAATPSDTPGRSVLRWSGNGTAEQTVPGRVILAADGAHWLFASPSEDGLRVTVGAAAGAAFTAVVPGAAATPMGLRAHGGAITCWHRTGRVLAVSADGTRLLANLRVTAAH